jgi:hypothetical protein
MQRQSTNVEPKIHPSIEHYEKTGQQTVELTGYLGSSQEGNIRLYSDISATSYIEIDKENIVNISTEDAEGRVHILVPYDGKISFISKIIAPANIIKSSNTNFTPGPRPPIGPITGCIDLCERAFAEYAPTILGLKRAGNDSAAGALTIRAKSELEKCLGHCHVNFFGGVPALVHQLSQKYLEEP